MEEALDLSIIQKKFSTTLDNLQKFHETRKHYIVIQHVSNSYDLSFAMAKTKCNPHDLKAGMKYCKDEMRHCYYLDRGHEFLSMQSDWESSIVLNCKGGVYENSI